MKKENEEKDGILNEENVENTAAETTTEAAPETENSAEESKYSLQFYHSMV